MSLIDSLSSAIGQHDSITAKTSGSSTSESEASLLAEVKSNSSATTEGLVSALTQQSSSTTESSLENTLGSLLFSKSESLGTVYTDAKSLSSAAGTLASKTADNLTYSDVSDFVSKYNALLDDADESTASLNGSDLESVKEAVSGNSEALAAIGITADSDGTLSIDDDTFESALASDSSSVVSTLESTASSVKTASSSLISDTLASYTASYQDSLSQYSSVSKTVVKEQLLGSLFDTKS